MLARDVYRHEKGNPQFTPKLAFVVFSHLIRFLLKPKIMSYAERESANPATDEHILYQFSMPLGDKIREQIKNHYDFDCPICMESDSFICSVDAELIQRKQIKLRGAICCFCELFIPKAGAYLTNRLLEEQVKAARFFILEKFDVDPDVPRPDYSKLVD